MSPYFEKKKKKQWHGITDDVLHFCVCDLDTHRESYLSDHYLRLKTGSLRLSAQIILSLTNLKCQLEKSGPVAAS